MTTLYYGDPHGEWRPLLRAAQSLQSGDTVIILGDCDLEQPIKIVLAPLFEHGIRVLWIPGNHDVIEDGELGGPAVCRHELVEAVLERHALVGNGS